MKKYLLLFLIMISGTVSSQNGKEKIEWRQDRPLTWADFKAEPPEKIAFEANTNSGISYTWSYSTQSGKPVLVYEVKTNFYPNLSWVREIEEEAYLLAHEQLHFDISELYARKLRKALEEYELGRNIRRDLNSLYNKFEKERVATQNRFDAETKHSKDREAELRWRKHIAEELKKLEEYSN